jgi:two-component system, NarL family, response regulator YdfI
VIRVFIAAASPIARAGLETLLRSQPGIAVVASAADADVVLTENAPGDEEPAWGNAAVVVFSDEPGPEWVREALRSGVRAVLPRQATEAEVLAAVAAAGAGLVALEPQTMEPLLQLAAPAPRGAPGPGAESLTPREIEVLRMLAEGDGNKGIAWKLGISEHTVKFHVASIMSKLEAASRTEAVATGIRRGLIPL